LTPVFFRASSILYASIQFKWAFKKRRAFAGF
jgi:hypothetical protein